MNGLMNKLCDETKDNVVRALKSLFESNSVTICSFVLKDCIVTACGSETQLMLSLIPVYAAVVAALHFAVGVEVGAYIIESLAVVLHEAILSAVGGEAAANPLIHNKLPSNALLLLVYLYNLRVLHHTLVVDIMSHLADFASLLMFPSQGAQRTGSHQESLVEMRAEMLEVLINHCGHSIRSDDPVSLKLVIATLTNQFKSLLRTGDKGGDGGGGEGDGGGGGGMTNRLRFMFEALTDLKNNKSRRVQTIHAETVKKLRRWLGTIKTSLPRKAGAAVGDACLRVSLRDLLDADKRGR